MSQRSSFTPALTARLILMLSTSVLILGARATLRAEDYTYTTNNGEITITKYIGSACAVEIPATINGLPVTTIAEYAFYGRACLSSVTIPDTVRSLGYYAFGDNSSLTNVSIAASVTNIGGLAFAHTGLSEVTLSKNVTSIGNVAFGSCSHLIAITVDPANPNYASKDGVLFNRNQTTLVQYPAGRPDHSYVIPNAVSNLAPAAFSSSLLLTNVSIPDGVTTIPNSAFIDCAGLVSVAVPPSVTNIEQYAFYDCYSLEKFAFPTGTTRIQYSFERCTGLREIVIPNTVTDIDAFAFDSCTSLTTVTIPASVTNLGHMAFGWCMGLKGMYFCGNAPTLSTPWLFVVLEPPTIYYLPGTSGWGATYADAPTALWTPSIETSDGTFGVRTNQFGFNITWASGMTVVVEASSAPNNQVWLPQATNTLISGSSYFSNPYWTNNPARSYRVRSP